MKGLFQRKWKKWLSIILAVTVFVSGIPFCLVENVTAGTKDVTIYFIDNSPDLWVGNDGAKLQLVDNTNGHTVYWMTKTDTGTWCAEVPNDTYNITFNRYNPEQSVQWNSWSAGGRDENNAYYADGSEYGHWEPKEAAESQNYFHAGDIVYLDLSRFTQWENDDAQFYVNFSNASKDENYGQDIDISKADASIYQPEKMDIAVGEHIYAYIVSFEEEGAEELRFWRGSDRMLWNCSVLLTYEDYAGHQNSVVVNGWNNTGDTVTSGTDFDKKKDEDQNGIPDYIDKLTEFGTEQYDSDKDGLPDFYEFLINSDKHCQDTDGDGVPDGYEIFTLGTSPVLEDSDHNGTSDGAEDFDGDGISNAEEYGREINPNNQDTDSDGIGDWEEINSYHTSPAEPDTDKDGLPDGLELKYNMNPLVSDTLGDGIPDGERLFDVSMEGESSDNGSIKPVLSMELQGKQIDSLSIDKVESSNYFLNENIPGYIGNAFELRVEGAFEEAVVTFEIDESLWEENFLPAVYYWDEEHQVLTEQEQSVLSGNTITVKLEHFSKYIVINKNAYNPSLFEFRILEPKDEALRNKTFQVSFVLDESGSISSSNWNLMKRLCGELVESLAEDDRIAVFTFGSSVRKRTGFADKATAAATISNMIQGGGRTAVYDGIRAAVREFDHVSGDESTRIMIVLTDGKDNESSVTSTVVTGMAAESGIVIYTIGVGNVNTGVLSGIATATGGTYYNISGFSELESVFQSVISKADLYKDTDGDGISDYHEKKIALGELKGGLGTPIRNFGTLSYLNPDSDGDGIPDGEELEIKGNVVNGEPVYYCYLHSNPCLADSDGDSLGDIAERYIGTNPLNSINEIPRESGMPLINTWADWQELIEEHAWNYIHNEVQRNARKMNPLLYPIELVLPVGKVDLYRRDTSEMWEVKPSSFAFSPRKELALIQLNRYVSFDEEYKIGGNYIKNGNFITADGNYIVSYVNQLNGLVLYRFKRRPKSEYEYEYQPAVEEDRQEKNEKVYTPVHTTNDYGFWATLAGLAIIGGTVVEDVLTGGIGITDDAASFAAALALIKH